MTLEQSLEVRRLHPRTHASYSPPGTMALARYVRKKGFLVEGKNLTTGTRGWEIHHQPEKPMIPKREFISM